MTRFRPSDPTDLAEIVAAALAHDEPLELLAGRSKRCLGHAVAAAHVVDLSGFAGIRDYEPAELVLTAGAATPLDAITATLAEAGQMLAFEPPNWRALLGGDPTHHQTLGGVIACNLAGPRRLKAGAARDHVLGFTAVNGRGEIFKSGGKVVKNVTGYDLSKLMAGSYGTLAALTEVSVKVVPRPETTTTLALRGLDDATALRAMTLALNSSHDVGGAAHVPAGIFPDVDVALTVLRLEGPVPSVAARASALAVALVDIGAVDTLVDASSHELWRAIRDVLPFAGPGDHAVWRLSLPPSTAPGIAADLARCLELRHFYDWGGGLLWLAVGGAADGGAAAVRAALAGCGGHATLIAGRAALRAAVPVFPPLAPALAALTARVKASFDPGRVFNRGRMYRDP